MRELETEKVTLGRCPGRPGAGCRGLLLSGPGLGVKDPLGGRTCMSPPPGQATNPLIGPQTPLLFKAKSCWGWGVREGCDGRE